MVEITFDSAVAALNKAVASQPEGYIYTNTLGRQARVNSYGIPEVSCEYLYDDGEPSCIVGHVLFEHGINLLDLGGVSGSYFGALSSVLEARGTLKIDNETVKLLNSVQRMQDRGTPWATAVSRALEDTKTL